MATTRKSVVRFQERAELLDFLLDVADATSESLDLDRILANIASYVKEVIPYDVFAILLYTERQKGLRIRFSIGHREEVVRNLIVKLDEG
ncbi:MAG: serine/threonine protein phosphatase, partial [Acidobacteriota bacterium]|nr:serine/threonine protein phosphatase [Acidobacteriota bacterium]